jgi:hypothetical protein
MTWQLIYDWDYRAINMEALIVPFVIALVAWLTYFYFSSSKVADAKPFDKVRSIFGALFGCMATFVFFLSVLSELGRKYGDYKPHKAVGVISNLKPIPSNGHGNETFKVGNVRFSLSSSKLREIGYKNLRNRISVFKNGLNVRIFYIKQGDSNTIVSVEIAKTTSSTKSK